MFALVSWVEFVNLIEIDSLTQREGAESKQIDMSMCTSYMSGEMFETAAPPLLLPWALQGILRLNIPRQGAQHGSRDGGSLLFHRRCGRRNAGSWGESTIDHGFRRVISAMD
jgi:hypothetical protein